MANRSKLAVILHADVVGSTALVRKDEALAHDRIQAAFRLFSQTLQTYGGTVHEIRGDALVAEFSRASDAVLAAVAAQKRNADRNAELTDEIVPILRVGIALGEVVVDDRTVTGAGVILAQRLEQMAEPYGICVSEAIREAAPDRLPVDYKDLGSQEAKGFDEPVHAYTLALGSGETIPEPARYDSEQGRSEEPSRKWFTVAVVALVLIAGGLLAWLQPWKSPLEPVVANQSPLRLSGKPSIAVLAFNNMSADADQDYLAMGVSEDLITELSKVSELFVIARNSSFSYRSKSLPIKTIAAELGVRFILEGSVQKAGEAVRINAQLIDASTQEPIWADRFDGDLSKAFAFQDRVVAEVRGALTNTLVGRTVTSNIGSIDASAHDAFLRGWSSYILTSPEDYAEALPHFDRAIRLDGRYGRAHAARASLLLDARAEGWHRALGMTPDDLIEQALWSLDQASNDPTALEFEVRSELALEYFKFDESIAFADRAIALNPNGPGAQATKARALAFAGRPAEAVALVSEAIRRDPAAPARYLFLMGVSYFGMERYTDAVATLERTRTLAPEHRRVRSYLVAAYGQLGRADSASQHITKLRDLAKTASVPWVLNIGVMDTVIHPYRNEIDTERFREGLRRGGLPEFKEEWALDRANRLSGEELRAISFGRIQHGRHPESGLQFSMKRDEKGRFQASGIWESTGNTRVVGDRLCNYWERYDLESCAVIYRNPDADGEAPYTIVQRSGVYLLRVESATKS